MGERGIIEKARRAAEETERAMVQEELELKLIDLQMEKIEAGEELTTEDIVTRLRMLEGIQVDTAGNTVDGEYKKYGFIIDKDLKVTVSSKLKGAKPEGIATVVTQEDGLEEVQIQVMANFNEGTISSIEAISENLELMDDPSNSDNSQIFIAKDNGEYFFRITASNGRSIKVSCAVSNAIPPRDDIINAAARIDASGIKKAKVMGKTIDGSSNEVVYSFDVVHVNGDLILDGTNKGIKGLNLVGKTYSLGSTDDIGTATTYAANTVLLKVEGNLTINSGITLTAVTGTYGGPKGMVIYCKGTLTNAGSISMTARGAQAKPENVFIYKNLDGSFEYVPATGGAGGAGAAHRYGKGHGGYEGGAGTTAYGGRGTDGSGRGTGGGRGGAAAWQASYYCSGRTLVAVGGTGGTGTAYSGGPGGGSAKTYADSTSYQGDKYGGNGSNERRCCWLCK